MYCDKIVVLTILLLHCTGGVLAQPDFSKKTVAEDIVCFLDAKDANIAYYTPGELAIATNNDGKPDFNFLQTRYTGTAAYGDQHSFRFNSIVRFRVVMKRCSAEKLNKVKQQLWPNGGNVSLRPLPISDIKSNLFFVGIENSSDTTNFSGGLLSAENKNGLNQKGAYWIEREFTLRLDSKSSQSLWETLNNGQSMMSLSYAFFSEGMNNLEDNILTEGESEILDEIEKRIENAEDSSSLKVFCIRADAFSISINADKWPELLTKIDINEEVPPAYAALEVRCYDFNNQLRPDLLAKRIEIKAKGVGRGDVLVKANFSPKNPDIYVYNIKFPYAVRLDQPLFFRVTSVGNETAPVKTEWIERKEWAGIIDITSPEEEIISSDEFDQE